MARQVLDLRARPTMVDIWMATARHLAQRSQCQRLGVGCVVTDKSMRRVLGNGYNGLAAGSVMKCEGTDPCCLHAEVNALIASGSMEKDKVMFVTVTPCKKCSMMIVNSGFSRVVYEHGHEKSSEGAVVLVEAGILLEKYNGS